VQAIGRQHQRAPDGAPVHYERHRPEQTTLKILMHLGLQAQPPPKAPARAPCRTSYALPLVDGRGGAAVGHPRLGAKPSRRSVEAMVAGPPQAVERIVAWARRGPRSAAVAAVDVHPGEGAFDAFDQWPTD
jgi:hypothetical protein